MAARQHSLPATGLSRRTSRFLAELSAARDDSDDEITPASPPDARPPPAQAASPPTFASQPQAQSQQGGRQQRGGLASIAGLPATLRARLQDQFPGILDQANSPEQLLFNVAVGAFTLVHETVRPLVGQRIDTLKFEERVHHAAYRIMFEANFNISASDISRQCQEAVRQILLNDDLFRGRDLSNEQVNYQFQTAVQTLTSLCKRQ